MKWLRWQTLLFWVIIAVAILLRFYNLGDVPPGVNRDEAAIGYNAYSLLLTGKDEYGRSFPVSFESFGDWKLPVYIYETILTVSIFGLNDLAVRIPSAIAGLLSVVFTYFLVKELFGKKSLALLTAGLLAISPWSLHLSRVSSEANTSMCIVLGAVLLILIGIRKRNWLILPGACLLALSFATYASNYVFTPLLALGIFIIYFKDILKNKFIIPAAILFIFLSGFLWFQTTSANSVKISGTGIFGDPVVVRTQIQEPRAEHPDIGIVSTLFHNKAGFAAERFFENYLNAFSPNFLFISGGTNNSHNIENFGNMYLIEALFFFFGLAYLILNKKTKAHYLVLVWLLIGPVAASLTKDAPHTVRMFAIFPIPILITTFGLLWLVAAFPRKLKTPAIALLILLYVINIAVYFDRYYLHFPRNEAARWGLGYEKLAQELGTNPELQNKKIIMSEVNESPYIFMLFYSKYNPEKYQQEAQRYPMTYEGFVHVKGYGNYTFKEIDWAKDPAQKNTILVSKSKNVPPTIRAGYKTKDIMLPSGESMFTILQTDNKILSDQ